MTVNAPQLHTKTVTLSPDTVYRVKGEPTRWLFIMQFDPTGSSGGFDVAFVPRGHEVQEENYVDGVGKEITRVDYRTGCSNDIYIRDTNNSGDEIVYFVSDVPIEIEVVT